MTNTLIREFTFEKADFYNRLIVDLFKDSNLFLLVSSFLIPIFRGTDWLDFFLFFFFFDWFKVFFYHVILYYQRASRKLYKTFSDASGIYLGKYRIANVAFMYDTIDKFPSRFRLIIFVQFLCLFSHKWKCNFFIYVSADCGKPILNWQ